jgi:hypothetical protein
MRVISILTIIIIVYLLSDKKSLPSNTWMLPIVPHPQEIFLPDKKVYFKPNHQTQILLDSFSNTQDSSDIRALSDLLVIDNLRNIKIESEQQSLDSSNIIFILKTLTDNPVLKQFPLIKEFNFREEYPGPEGYLLHVTPQYVLLAGHDIQGRYYAIQSLLKLIVKDKESGAYKIPVVTIIDYPDMPLRSAFYGFYLNAMEDDSSINRAYCDFRKISHYKFNMIDLASHHYGHLEMEVPGHPQEKLWQRFARLHQEAQRYHLRPRVGGWAKWVNTNSTWGADLTTLECIRTSQIITMEGTNEYLLKISTGQNAPNVMYDSAMRKSWQKEPLIVTSQSGMVVYEEGKDYIVNFGEIQSKDCQEYYQIAPNNLHVLFNKVHYGEGEPEGYPLRWGETFNPSSTIQRLKGGRIQDGQKVKISFSYIGPDPWSLIKVRYCRSDERLHTDSSDNYIWRWCTEPVRFWGADDFSIDSDETRVFAWDKRCQDSGKSRSRIWADDIRYYYNTIRKSNPSARISLWSDMLDPGHNAPIYKTENIATIFNEYDMTDIIMIPWKQSIARNSVAFFAENNFPVMASCMKAKNEAFISAPQWAHWIRHYYENKELAHGMMYCRWGYGLDLEETWQHLESVADHAWSIAPYILHSPMKSAIAGHNIEITARYEGDHWVFDGQTIRTGPLTLLEACLHYRTQGDSSFQKIKMPGYQNIYRAVIPHTQVEGNSMEYYISMTDKNNTTFCPNQSANRTFKIIIREE